MGRGGNLRELWSQSNAPHQKEAIAWFSTQVPRLADALRTIHAVGPYGLSGNRAGICHGDLKSENILRFPNPITGFLPPGFALSMLG